MRTCLPTKDGITQAAILMSLPTKFRCHSEPARSAGEEPALSGEPGEQPKGNLLFPYAVAPPFRQLLAKGARREIAVVEESHRASSIKGHRVRVVRWLPRTAPP
jgi:hypothetical protein